MTNTLSRISRAARGEETSSLPEVGDWCWVSEKDGERELGCVTHVGSNFVMLKGPSTSSVGGSYIWRIHFDRVLEDLEPEPNAEALIQQRIAGHQGEVNRLLGEVRDLTRRLSVGGVVADSQETQALALRDSGESLTTYKGDLIRAKDETLPGLFKQIEKENALAAAWMRAPLIPMEAQADRLKGSIEVIERRIFNVELYAGLVEQVTEVAKGEAAPYDEPIRLFQRRAYMDEECLARYQVGGMEFADIGEFDQWMARPENRDRLLPFPRCILAMQVRRKTKERDIVSLWDFIRFEGLAEADKLTYLYIRNGEQVYRLSTGIEFGAQLFPDRRALDTSCPLYFKVWGDRVDGFLTEGEYEAKVAEYEEHQKQWEAGTKEQRRRIGQPWPRELDRYSRYSPESVYYDDATRFLQKEIDHHNRLVLVLQGLLDRSPVLHPHPPWQLWEEEGFDAALELIFDDSRGLTPGEAPDFEAYRARLNESIGAGTVTVGQEDFWLRREAKKECDRRARDWKDPGTFRPKRFRPFDDPGPGVVARVDTHRPRARDSKFVWCRESRDWHSRSMVRKVVVVPDGDLLNADAYKAGDFRQFFDDPRTRADYLQWAPLLLEAEEYKAGNRTVREPGDYCE